MTKNLTRFKVDLGGKGENLKFAELLTFISTNVFEDYYFTDSQSEIFVIINHLLLIFKYYVFKSRSNNHLTFLQLTTDIIKVKTLEEDLNNQDNNKGKKHRKKWQKISDIFV